jgi:hypothetical protein
VKVYVVEFYNRFACQTQRFHVYALDEEDAERIFWLKYDKDKMKDCIEVIYIYSPPYVYTESEIIGGIK